MLSNGDDFRGGGSEDEVKKLTNDEWENGERTPTEQISKRSPSGYGEANKRNPELFQGGEKVRRVFNRIVDKQ